VLAAWLLYVLALPGPFFVQGSRLMRRSSSLILRILCVAAAAGVTVFAAAPSFATPAPKPQPKPTADQIVTMANADLHSVTSYNIYTSAKILSVTISVSETVTAQGCLDVINGGHGISEKILNIGGSEWIQPSNQFWVTLGYSGTTLDYLDGKWVTADAFLKLLGISNPPSTAAACSTASPTGIPVTGWTLVRKAKISGGPAWRVVNKHLKLTAYVSDTAQPEYLRLTLLGITEYFSAYNAPIYLAPPLNTYLLNMLPPLPGGGLSSGGGVGPQAGMTARAGVLAHSGWAGLTRAGLAWSGARTTARSGQ
jgi:hypothetical protein